MRMSQTIDIPAIRDFLSERGYKLQMNFTDTSIWRKDGGKIVWEISTKTYNEAMREGLNHWLCKQLGIHWGIVWAHHAIGIWDTLKNKSGLEYVQAIKKAIFWHDALSKEAKWQYPKAE